jgi:hypothetical protein
VYLEKQHRERLVSRETPDGISIKAGSIVNGAMNPHPLCFSTNAFVFNLSLSPFVGGLMQAFQQKSDYELLRYTNLVAARSYLGAFVFTSPRGWPQTQLSGCSHSSDFYVSRDRIGQENAIQIVFVGDFEKPQHTSLAGEAKLGINGQRS